MASCPVQRLERIRRNQEVLVQLGIRQMAQDLVTACHEQQQPGIAAGPPRQRRLAEVRWGGALRCCLLAGQMRAGKAGGWGQCSTGHVLSASGRRRCSAQYMYSDILILHERRPGPSHGTMHTACKCCALA